MWHCPYGRRSNVARPYANRGMPHCSALAGGPGEHDLFADARGEQAVVGVGDAELPGLRVEHDLEVVEQAPVGAARADAAQDALQADTAPVVRDLGQRLLDDLRA